MSTLTRRAAPHVIALGLVLAAASAACAQTQWPSLFRYTLSLSSDETAAYQASASLSGRIGENYEAKIEGWWISGTEPTRDFLGDTYIAYDRSPWYLAGGRKYVVFGPAGGVLVSPGLEGGALEYDNGRYGVQVIGGELAFTPGTGETRFTYAGSRASSDEDFTAARVQALLTRPDAQAPVTVGVNWLDVLDDDGYSADIQVGVTPWLSLYGEAADFDDENGSVVGVSLSDAALRNDGRAWIFVIYYRDIDINYVPAQVGATSYFEGQDGLVGALYYQMDPNHAVGVYVDDLDAIITWFHNIPFR
jgi:hypothetical protein